MGKRGPESGHEPIFGGEAVRPHHWLGKILDRQFVESANKTPLFEGHTTAWVIYQGMLIRLIEGGSEMDPIARKRLQTLVQTFRIVARPRMNPQEQEEIGIFFSRNQSLMLDAEELRYAVREVLDDLEFISNEFDMPLNPQY